MKCPFCSEEIKDDAQKCRFCGEWLVSQDQIKNTQSIQKDNSDIKPFEVYLTSFVNGKKTTEYKLLFAHNEAELKLLISNNYKDYTIEEQYGIKEVSVEKGKYSCPSCKAKYTNCQKKIGCAIMIVIFVSFGLGLIMIPFLPYHCECKVCGHRWKS